MKWLSVVLALFGCVSCASLQQSPPSQPETRPSNSVREFFVSETGRASGDGSIGRPWDLQTALSQPASRIRPGSTVWLRGGTYVGRFKSMLAGSSEAPIVVRAYRDEAVRIDGNAPGPLPGY